jgi:outer membrane biosynthesis protein TonB
MAFNNLGPAWNPESGENERLGKVSAIIIPVFLIVAFYVSWIDLPEQSREEMEALPPQLAKVIIKKKKPKPIVKKELKKEIKKAEPEKKVAKKPKPQPKPKAKIAKKPKPKIKPKAKDIQLAREKAKTSGLLAMSSQLSTLSNLANSVKLDTPKMVSAKPIARKVEDKLASRAKSARSSGIDETKLTQETQGIALASRELTEVDRVEEIQTELALAELEEKQTIAERTREDIRRTMDANKSAINSIYNRALRKKPSLQGAFTAQLVVEPSGQVSSCSALESTLNEPKLESKICKRLRLVNFGHKPGVDKTTISYPIELFPG